MQKQNNSNRGLALQTRLSKKCLERQETQTVTWVRAPKSHEVHPNDVVQRNCSRFHLTSYFIKEAGSPSAKHSAWGTARPDVVGDLSCGQATKRRQLDMAASSVSLALRRNSLRAHSRREHNLVIVIAISGVRNCGLCSCHGRQDIEGYARAENEESNLTHKASAKVTCISVPQKENLKD